MAVGSILFQQTDTSSVDAVFAGCTGRGLATVTAGRQCSQTGTAGTGTPSVTIGASQANKVFAMFETSLGEMDSKTVNAGTWVIPFNITTGAGSSGNEVITEVWVCRCNSAGVNQATIASASGLNRGVDATGVITFNVTGGIVQAFSTGDRLTIFIVGSNNDIATHPFNFKPDQVMQSPGNPPTYNLYNGPTMAGVPTQPVKGPNGLVLLRPPFAQAA